MSLYMLLARCEFVNYMISSKKEIQLLNVTNVTNSNDHFNNPKF